MRKVPRSKPGEFALILSDREIEVLDRALHLTSHWAACQELDTEEQGAVQFLVELKSLL